MIYERQVFMEIWKPFLITFVGLNILFLMGRLLVYIEPLLNAGITLDEFARLIMLMIPVFIKITLPIATLLGALIAAMRLSRDSEMIALFSCGASVMRLVRPFAIFAFICWLITMFTTIEVVPQAKTESRAFIKQITRMVLSRGLPARTFFSPARDLTFYIDRTDEAGKKLSGIYIRDERKKNISYQILARSGNLAVRPDRAAIVLQLFAGTMTRHGYDKKTVDLLDFRSYVLSLSMPVYSSKKSRGELGMKELYRRGYHDSSVRPEKALYYLVEYYKRLAMPVGTLFFGIMAMPLGIFLGRTGISGGIAAGIACFLSYYMTVLFASSMAEEGLVTPFISLWIPDVLFGILTVWLLKRLAEKGPLTV